MDVARTIDLVQVILQDPRVAEKKASVIFHAEANQQLAREQAEAQQRIVATKIEKSNVSEQQDGVSGDKDKRRRKGTLLYTYKGKKRKKKIQAHKNVINTHHVDVVI